jgi:hypothetical protein
LVVIASADVQQLLSQWWFAYDNAIYSEWPEMFTGDAHFICKTDTGRTAYEEFVNADVRGRDAVLEWQTQHRQGSPYPLRHGGENIHISAARENEADFRSYIRVSQIVNGSPSDLSTAIVNGTVRLESGKLRIAALTVILDTEDSTVIGDRKVY